MAATRFAVVKTDTPGLLHALRQTPNLNRPPRRFAMVKPILITSTGLLQALRQSKSTLQTSTGIFPFMRLSRHLYLATTRFKVVKTDSPKLYWTPTRFAVVKNGLSEPLHDVFAEWKTDTRRLYWSAATRYAVVKTDSPDLYI